MRMLRFAIVALGLPAFAVAVVLLAAGGASQDAGAASNIAGDVTCDGTVNSVDALQVLRSVAGLSTNAGCMADAGDVDCSGAINSVDALKILRYVAGLPNQYPAGCTPIGEETASSASLIAAALEAGEITEEEATVYQVLAAFGDSRLPDEYHGAPSDLPDSDAAMIAAAQFEDLSAEAQDTLRPFLTPPYVEGSWLDLPTVGGAAAAATTETPEPTINPAEWTTFEAAGGEVKVWGRKAWPTEVIKAEEIAEAVSDTIWPSLIGLMGVENAPLSDVEYPNNGGDGALDIYVVDVEDALGVTIPYIEIPEDPNTGEPIGPCEMSPAYIQIEPDVPLGSATAPGMLSTVAHEVFHAFQMSFDLHTNCWWPEYKWFMEASATWAEDYVYPQANAEHVPAAVYFFFPGLSLDSEGFLFSAGHDYGAYVFPFYVSHRFNAPEVVLTVWENFAGAASLPAIQAAIEPYGGFEELWPEFVLYNWNRDDSPVHYYRDWDGLAEEALLDLDSPVMVYPPGGGKPKELKGEFYYLSATYYSAVFPNWDAFPVRSVTLKNTMWQNPDINIQGMVKIGDMWQPPEDWSGKEEVTFCRDEDSSKRIEQMIIIISNSDWDTQQDIKPAVAPTLEGSEIGCTRWVGEATMTYHSDDAFITNDRTAVATGLVFEQSGTAGAGAHEPVTFELKEGSLAWSVTSTFFCTVSFSGSYDLPGQGAGALTITEGTVALLYHGLAYTRVFGEGECEEGSSGYSYSFTGDEQWFRTAASEVSEDPSHLRGTFTFGASSYTYTYTWDLRAAPPEPSPSPAVPR